MRPSRRDPRGDRYARMPTHAEKRRMPYSADEMFALIADVAAYPEFLPWCSAARIRKRTERED